VPASVIPGGAAFNLAVSGSGFVSGSIVQWNGSARTTTYVSSSKLTAAISAADIATATTATITVVSPAPGGGISNFQFLSVDYSATTLSFSAQTVTGQVAVTSPVVEGDFNNDGKLDLAVALGSNVYVLLGNGDGTYPPAVGSNGPSGATITGIHVADLNNDGKLDLVVTGSKSTSKAFVATMLGNGNGTFQAPVESDFNGQIPNSAALADFSGDGSYDLVYTTATSIQTLTGNPDGTFSLGPNTPINYIGLAVAGVGDFNKDGILDLVVTVYDPFTTGYDFSTVMLGNGDGSFGAPTQVGGSGSPYVGAITAVVGDFNHDGNLDIATGIETVGAVLDGFIQVSLGNGDGTFQSATNVPNVSKVTTPLIVADFNGDGNLDLATGGFFYFGQGDGTFPTNQGSSTAPTFVLAGDANGDGIPDIVDENITLNKSSVLSQIGLELQIPPTPDFKGLVSPLVSTLVPGGSVSFQITLEPLYGFTGDVILGALDLPNGITPSYNPVLVHGGNGTSTITLTAASNLPLGDYSVTFSGNSGTLTHTTTLPLVVNSSVGDFTGYVSQQAQNIAPDGATEYAVMISPLSGFTGNVSLSVTGLPSGVTANFSNPTITGGSGSALLELTSLSTTPQPAVTNITITATSGILVHSTTVYLGVRTGTGDFAGTITPSSQSVASAGGTATFAINVSPLNGGAGDVALSTVNLPDGATALFTPPAIPGGSGSSTLAVTIPSGTTPGTYPIYVNLEGAGVVHQGGISLTVTP
jgi:hypothetical protein